MLPESSEGYERKQDNCLQWEVLAKLNKTQQKQAENIQVLWYSLDWFLSINHSLTAT